MKYITLFIFIISLTLSNNSFSQEDWTVFKKRNQKDSLVSQVDTIRELNYNTAEGKISINQTSEIDSLTKQIEKAPFIIGYTGQIEVSQQKSVIRDARYKFLKKYPDTPLDDDYNAPNTYLYGGRFYDRNTAYEFKHHIAKYFPDAIVIQKKLALPPLSGENNN